MKNVLVVLTIACSLLLALAGCSSGESSSSNGQSSQESSQQQEATQDNGGSEDADGKAGMGNPWSDVTTAAQAAEGAGLDVFDVPEGSEIDLGKVEFAKYRCMKGIAEAIDEFPAVEMTIRKGLNSAAVETVTTENGVQIPDISGDYGEYKHTWTQNIKGLEITCLGNRKGDASKTVWSVGDYCWSINVLGLGGDTDYGLSADDLNTLVNGIQ